MKKCLASIFTMMIITLASAQETSLYDIKLNDFHDGKNFFEEGLYLQAKSSLEGFIDMNRNHSNNTVQIQEAELMIAKSSIYMRMNDGEQLLLSFIRKYHPEKVALDAIMELAEYYFDNKMYQESIRYYEMLDGNELDNNTKAKVKFKQGYAYFVKDEKAKAKEAFTSIQYLKGPHYEETNYYLGILAFEDNEYDTAISAFKNANTRGKYNKVVPYYLCQIHFANGEFDDVIEIGEEALDSKDEIDYENSVVHLVAKSYFELNQYGKALPYFEIYSNNAKKLRAQDLYQVAFTRYKMGQYEGAIKDFEELKTSDNEMGQNALYNLGDSYLKNGDKFSARNAFYGASKKDYDEEIQKESHYLYAKLSYDLGFDREAIAALQNIPATSPYHVESQEMLGRIFMNTKDYDKAIQMMESIPNKTATIKEAYQKVTFFKGVQLFNDNNFNESKIYLNMSLKTTPNVMNKAQAQYYLGEIAHKQKQYDKSIQYLNEFINMAKGYFGLPEETSIEMANYIQGYNYLKKKNYSKSGSFFDNTISGLINSWDESLNDDIKIRIFPDAVLRAGDAYFMLKNYDKSLSYYQTSINYKYQGYDYALFQKARIEYVRGNTIDQVTSLKILSNDLPNSTYADDALLQLGTTYFRERQFGLAESTTLKLVNNYKQTSNLVNKGYILLGLVSFNQNDSEKSLMYYEKVFANNPTQEEQATALQSIREIYIDNNNPDGFIDFQERVLGKEVSTEDREAITYRAAELQYENSEFEAAIAAYTKYINKYPNGLYTLQAHYNRGESHLASKSYSSALPDYDYVVSKGNSSFYEKALTKAASISYNYNKSFRKAYDYYAALAKVATDDDKKFDAHLGALRSAFKSGYKSGVYSSADDVIKSDKSTNEQKSTAHFYKAKMALDADDYNTALVHFRSSSNSNNAQGAESRYQIAYIYYLQRDLTVARELCMAHLKKSKNYESWVARGLLLLSDITFEQGDLFNARAALETLIENYDDTNDPGIIDTAKEKLKKIEERESDDSRIIPE